jgi:hypothetical protein
VQALVKLGVDSDTGGGLWLMCAAHVIAAFDTFSKPAQGKCLAPGAESALRAGTSNPHNTIINILDYNNVLKIFASGITC